MLDIKWIRDNAAALDAALAKRGAEPLSAFLIDLDEKRRALVQSLQDKQSRRNAASKEIGAAMAAKDSALADRLKAGAVNTGTAKSRCTADHCNCPRAATQAMAATSVSGTA